MALALAASFSAHADNECGRPTITTIVCEPGDKGAYPTVQYDGVTDFDLLLKAGVVIDGSIDQSVTNALRVWGSGDIDITAEDGVVITNQSSPNDAVDVFSSGGSVNVALDQVHGGGGGIRATSFDGDVAVSANKVSGAFNAIAASSVDGNVDVTVGEAKASDGTAIRAFTGEGDVDVYADIIQANNGSGVDAYSGKGNVNVDVMLVEALGADGIVARAAEGDVNVSAGMVLAEGFNIGGINAMADKGNVNVDTGYVFAGGDYGIALLGVALEGDVTLHVGDYAYANGAGSTAILAFSYTGDIDISGVGAATYGDWSTGVSAVTYEGAVSVDVQNVVSEGGRGISVEAGRTACVGVDYVGTSGLEGVGIEVLAGGDTTIAAGEVSTMGENANGIDVFSSGIVNIDVEKIIVSGAGSEAMFAQSLADVNVRVGDVQALAGDVDGNAIFLSSNTGSVNLQVDGSVRSTTGNAIGLDSQMQRANVVVAEGAHVFGQDSAIVVGSKEGGRIDIAGTVESANGPAVRIGADSFNNGLGTGDLRIARTGALSGFVSMSEGDDVLSNAGTFAARGVSLFSGGDDAFVNAVSGTLALHDTDTIAFGGLERFDNAGTIVLANGRIGDAFTTDGTLNGAGGTVAVDFDIQRGKADTVYAGAFTGANVIHLDYLGRGAALGISDVLVASSDGEQTGNEVVLARDSQTRGFIGFKLDYDNAGNWLLSSDLAEDAYVASIVPTAVRDVWRQGTAAIDSHQMATRGAADTTGAWAQAYGGDLDGESRLSHSLGKTDLAWRGDNHGVLVGAETAFEYVRVGVAGSLGEASVHLGGDGRTDFDLTSLALYATYEADGWYTAAVVRGEQMDVASNWESIGLNAEGKGDTLGVSAEAGHRFDVGRVWLEPMVRVDWIETDLPSLASDNGQITWNTQSSSAAEVGLRIGADGWRGWRPYASLSMVREFLGNEVTVYDIGSQAVHVSEDAGRTLGRFVAGMSYTAGRFDVYGEGSSRTGDMEGVTGNVGVRVRF